MKKTALALMFLVAAQALSLAQQAPHFSQFTFSKLNLNPALLGGYESFTVSGFYRHQWFGVEGAPRTGLLNVVAPLTRHRAVVGMSLAYDQIGMTRTGSAAASYTYVVQLRNGLKVLGGLTGAVEYGSIDYTMANPADPLDALIGDVAEGVWRPNFGAGAAVHARNWYAGISVPRFLRNHLYRSHRADASARAYNELFLTGGIDVRIASMARFRPGMLVSVNPSAPMDIAIDASFLLYNQFILAAAYRLDDALTAAVQYRLNPMWKMGVAYDFTISGLNRYSNGTAEIMLEYSLDRVTDGTRHIRFF